MSGTPTRNTKRAAEIAEHEAVKAAMAKATETHLDDDTPTMAEWSPVYLAHVEATWKPNTLTVRAKTMAAYVLPVLGALRLHEITRRRLDELADHCRAAGLGPRSVVSVIDTCCSALRLAERREIIDAVPRPNRPRKVVDHERYLSEEQERAVLAVADARERAALLLGLRAGLRRGEISGAQWADLAPDGRGGRLRLARQYTKGSIVVPKSGKPRTVPISPDVWAALEAWRAASPVSDWIFPAAGDLAAPIPENEMTCMLRRVGRASKVQGLAWHLLRHTCASRLTAANVNLRTVQMILGHSSTLVTERYAHLAPDAMGQAVALIDERMAELPEPAAVDMKSVDTSCQRPVKTEPDEI